MLIWNQPKEGNPAVGHERLGGFPFLFLFWWTLLPRLDNHTTASLPCPFPPRGAWIRASFLLFVRPLFRLLFFAKGVAFRAPLVLIVHRAEDGFVERIKPWADSWWALQAAFVRKGLLVYFSFANTIKIGWFWAESMTFYVKMRDFCSFWRYNHK